MNAGKCIAQHRSAKKISFQHLNTSNGLSYMGVNDMCFDKKNNIWISTGNGLNMFNGKTVEKYFVSEYPQLQNNNIIHVTCDSHDRIWLLTVGGNVTMLDEERKMHRVSINVKDSFAKTFWILNSQKGGIILWTSKGHYAFNANAVITKNDSIGLINFNLVSLKGFDKMGPKAYRQVFYYDDDNYLFTRDDAFYKVNYKTQQVEKKYDLPNCTQLIKWGEGEVLASDNVSQQLEIINLNSGQVSFPFKNSKDQYGMSVSAHFYFAAKINEEQYIFTTFNKGIYIYNIQTKQFLNYKHNVADPTSINNNTTKAIAVSDKGWVFVNCEPNAIDYFNSRDIIENQSVFLDGKGNGYDGYIAGIATKDNNTYYLGTGQGLLEWKRNTNSTSFLHYTGEDNKSLFTNEEVTSIIIDKKERIWLSTVQKGILVLDKNKNLVKRIKNNCTGINCMKLQRAIHLFEAPDGYVWACGFKGFCRINMNSFEVDNFTNTPLAAFNNRFCAPMLFSDKLNFWFGTSNNGVFHYNLKTGQLDSVSQKDGLLSNSIFCLNADSNRNIYVGTRLGLNIIFPNGRIKGITQKDGLLIDRAEGLLLDKKGRMWIGNDVGLACYNPADSNLISFDGRYGLSIYGFRVNSYYQNSNGEFIFGTPKGIQYFNPDDLLKKKLALNVLINKIETREIVSGITGNQTFNLAANDNQVTFYFSSVDYSQYVRTYYQYKLVDIDKEWINITDQNSVRYNSLSAGTYSFKIRISNDGKSWQDAENTVTITIAKKIWQQWWFRLLGILAGVYLIWYVFNYYRIKQKKQHEELATKQKMTESHLQNLRLQMNPHFLFNALNSIQQMILANEDLVATKYLSRFSKLLRSILVHSDKETIMLKEEIDILKMYVELESMRFKESFEYEINCAEEIETEEIKIPALLIQPFVENAIWHGLMHKEGNRKLLVSFRELDNSNIQCIVQDNGIGRKKAAELKLQTGHDKKHKSKGIEVSIERIKVLGGSINITDLQDEQHLAAGTRVEINFPL